MIILYIGYPDTYGVSFFHGWICSIKDGVFDKGVSTFQDLGSTVHTVLLSILLLLLLLLLFGYWYNSIVVYSSHSKSPYCIEFSSITIIRST